MIGSNYKVNSSKYQYTNAGWNQIETILAYDESNYYDAFREQYIGLIMVFAILKQKIEPVRKRLTIHINIDVTPSITGSFYVRKYFFNRS